MNRICHRSCHTKIALVDKQSGVESRAVIIVEKYNRTLTSSDNSYKPSRLMICILLTEADSSTFDNMK